MGKNLRIGVLTLSGLALCWAASTSSVEPIQAAELQQRNTSLPPSVVHTPPFGSPTYLKAANAQADDIFGSSVAASGDTVVIGARGEDGSAGAAYVFVRNAGTWSQQAYLKSSSPGSFGLFGQSVAISGNTLVVGASNAIYIFVRNGTTWSQQAELTGNDGFGESVAVSGDIVVVGASSEDGSGTGVNPASDEAAPNAGAAYVFVRSGSVWSQQAYLKASDTEQYDRFGSSVSVSGETIVVGAPFPGPPSEWIPIPPPVRAVPNSGAAYVFVRSLGTWSQQSYLLASNPGAGDYFGGSVAVSGDTIVVGAMTEDGSGAGVNPPQDDNAVDAGAGYVFVRDGVTWTQQAYLKASNGAQFLDFGTSVAIDANTVVVGANSEDGGGTGVDPIPRDAISGAGSAYVFARTGATWTHQAYLKASKPGQYDHVGDTVAVSGDTVVLDAHAEDGGGAGVNPASNESAQNSGAAYIFSRTTIPSAPTPASQVDLNGDGNGDAFLYDGATGNWSRQLGQTGGGFIEESHDSWLPGWTVLPANFDGNALTDFFLFNAATGAWAKMLNDGTTKNFTAQSSGFWWSGWQRFVMDLDGDNISDLFLYDSLTGQWFECVSTPTGFTYTQGQWTPGWEITPANLNNDGLGDLFLIDRTTGQWFWVVGKPGLGFLYPQTGTWSPSWQLSPADFNGDGLGDLLLHDPSSGEFYVAMNTGTDFSYTGGIWSPGWTVGVGDLDADAKDDLFLHNPDTGQWFEMISNGGGTFTDAGGQFWSLGWGLSRSDVNGDGRTDIVLYDAATGGWYQARNLVNGSFTYNSGVWSPGWTIVTRAAGR